MTIQTETSRIVARDYDLGLSGKVFEFLDHNDTVEALVTRGARGPATGLVIRQLHFDWHAGNAFRLMSLVGCVKRQMGVELPFAVFGVSVTGQAGVAQAALLAKAHFKFRRELAELAVLIRRGLPDFAAQNGLHRIEARSWAGHPTGGGLLRAIGFQHECTMPGFGADGMEEFEQYGRHFPENEQKE